MDKQLTTTQIRLFDGTMDIEYMPIVNVASVKKLSPFRYPGGKTWLIPEVRNWLLKKDMLPNDFIEPFAGGGIVSLTVASEKLASHVTMIELDPDVAAVWHTVFSDDSEWLAEKILNFNLTIENVQEELSQEPKSKQQHAFQTILKNRTYHGGILAPGSGLLKFGENGKGIASRWYAQTLAKRIRAISPLRSKISFIEGDGLEYIENTMSRKDIAYFIDPPYTAPGKRAGRRLYRYSEMDHENLFDICGRALGDFMMTYDNTDSVSEMAERHGFNIQKIPMKNTHHAKMFELIIMPPLKHLVV